MERIPYFVKSLSSGNIVVIDSSNRHYFNQMINVHKSTEYIYLDENEQIIGTLDLNPKEAEVYVEQVLEDLTRRENVLAKKEADSMQKEFDLTERERLLNEREARLNIAENTKANSGEITKIDKRSKEYKALKEN